MAGSLWASTMAAAEVVAAPPLAGDTDTDVVVVGAGYTGLWTAYYLAARDPHLRVTVLDAHSIGFGASGRNGGWCSALLPVSLTRLAARWGRDQAIRMQRAMHATVDEIAAVLTAEGADAHWAKAGTVTLARTPAQEHRLAEQLAESDAFGLGPDHLRRLGPAEAARRCRATSVRAAAHTPHCAAVHPLRLVHAVAAMAARRGVRLHEATPVTGVRAGAVDTARGRVRADVVVLATEAYTCRLPDRRRDVVPLYSLMIATEPLAADQWAAIGLPDRETFHDERHTLIYGQRTADDRLAFGGRGAPYHFGSAIADRFDTDRRIRARLEAAARELFPVLGDVAFPYHWGGPLAVPRDWHGSVRFDASAGLAVAGGYVGDGVATANLAGRTLADLITRTSSDLTDLAWVGHRSRRWEPEPLRWLGINLVRHGAARADAAESGPGRWPARRAALWRRLVTRLSAR